MATLEVNAAAAAPTPEIQYYDQLFAIIDKDDMGVLPGKDTLPFLNSSGLPLQMLGEIWAIADPENNGFLTKDGWHKAARIIGWLQSGSQTQVDIALANKPGPLPTFTGYPPPPLQQSDGNKLPPLTAADRTKFTRIFVGCGPSNGLVSGDKARDVFLKSQLHYDKLGQIWNLADTQQRGSLDLPDFIIGMYLIQSCMSNPALLLPTTLPPGTYEIASGGRAPPIVKSIAAQHTGQASPIQRQFTGGLQAQRTGQSQSFPAPPPNPSVTPTRQSTVGSNSFSSPVRSAVPWDVTIDAKATSDRFFSQLDTQNRGSIDGDVAVPFMLQSQLDEGTLASIWDLADIRQEGNLDRDEFAVAMYLINLKIAGKDLPLTLPLSLIPPSLRASRARAQEALPAPVPGSRDLFGLFDDALESKSQLPPPQPLLQQIPSQQTASREVPLLSPPMAGNQIISRPGLFSSLQPADDLLGDDIEIQTPVPNNSADIGNMQNQLANTTRATADLEKARVDLEKTTSSASLNLEELEGKLSAARLKHETESKAVGDLRLRVEEQGVKLKQLQAEVISAESDLTAMRLEKDELEQTLLRDREEIRGLQKQMKEVEDEKTGMKLLLEKLKKDARQQRGMVTITKKQLSTAEVSRNALQQDIRAAESELQPIAVASEETLSTAIGIPLPGTPQTISPEPTGTSQRSNNPFDRFNRTVVKQSSETVSGSITPTPGTAADLGWSTSTGTAQSDLIDPFGPVTKEHTLDPKGAAVETVPEGDSFGLDKSSLKSTVDHQVLPADASTDFDSAFADFDMGAHPQSIESQVEPELNATVIPPLMRQDGNDQSPASMQSPEAVAAEYHSPKAVATEYYAPEVPANPSEVSANDESSDEDEGPEDIDAPGRDNSKYSVLSTQDHVVPPAPSGAEPVPSADEGVTKVRRSAPPPPPARSVQSTSASATTADVDPFGAQVAPDTKGTPSEVPKTSQFDDDEEFDFSDIPPTKLSPLEPPIPTSSAFDDEFASFDDEFEKPSSHVNSGSDHSNSLSHTFEMVSPPTEHHDVETTRFDEWGINPVKSTSAEASSSLSFEDAFGGDFEPTSQKQNKEDIQTANKLPSGSTSAQHLQLPQMEPPSLPERRNSDQPQSDDLEDVKKLCAMGFPRSLVVEALDANGYDFQKALNVLLIK